jgi:Fe2+ transport system protein FeoA
MFELNTKEIMTGSKIRKRTVSLSETRAGQWLKIHSLPDGDYYPQFVRLGIHEGQRVKCLERLPGGTIVLQKSRQQIAIGHTLAKTILVVVLDQNP